MVSGTLYTPEGYHRSWRAQIAAQFSGATLNIVNFVPGVTDSDKSFLDKFPPATVPVFEANDGTCLFDVNAIAYFLGTDQLRGWKNTHLVTQWVNYADNSILPSVATWVYPCLGITQFNKQNTEKAKTCIASVLKFLNEQLSKITFLVGDRLSQADITVFTALHLLFTHVYEEKDRKPYPHVVRWYTTIANQPEVLKVVGPSSFCIKAAQFDAKKYAELHKKVTETKQPKETKKEKPKPEVPPKKEKPKDDDDEDDERPKPSKNPLANLPAGKFDMDAFKRVYSNMDIEKEAIPYFWSNFDPEAYSIWFCEYLYPEELSLVFMTCNLINGFFQRAEKMLKYAFGSMCIFGEDKKNTVSGLWIWRGTGLIFDLDEDLRIDYESYSWRKLDPNSEETKSLVHDYFTRKFHDKPFNQGKIFK
uniref:Eukaryotic translation elongation factor 1 gamma n=1 Tax=Schistosoma japonicum TaxID=6182 RepID=C1LB57_SCHJA|nr:eukaryotic translation elongation factor 1 gamma [Schistosoma japonicum]